MKELKTAKTFDEQLAILESRDMVIDDADAALRALKSMNYYRLTGYAYQFKHGKNERYKAGTSFETVLALYRFDKELRRVLQTYLEDIEIFARTQIAYYFGHVYGSGGHYDPQFFENEEYHSAFLLSLKTQIEKNKDAAFVSHHVNNYGGKMPIWSAVEILSFSALSKFYSNLQQNGRAYIATQMGYEEEFVANWLHCFSVLRNTCAHYGRIYDNDMKPSIKLGGKTYRAYPEIKSDTIFAYIICMERFIPHDKMELIHHVSDVIHRWIGAIDLGLLGFPDNWEKLFTDEKLLNPISKLPAVKRPSVPPSPCN